jgi:hypothetical protein
MTMRFRGTLFGLLLLAVCSSTAVPLQAQAAGGAVGHHATGTSPGGFVHAVYFWLRPDLSAEQQAAFVRGLQSLRGIETVQHGWIGVPAATDRPIIERSYSYALTLVFANDAAQEAYQVDPVHERFREEFGQGYWERVLIYDSVERTAHH